MICDVAECENKLSVRLLHRKEESPSISCVLVFRLTCAQRGG
jgi:hypothetical protein